MKYIYQSIYILIVIGNLLFAEIPETLSYQGYLSENGVSVSDGDYNITFHLYDAESSGSAVWTELHSGLSTINGVFNAILGESVDLPDDFSQQYWLSIEYDGSEISPRIQLTSSAYSLASRNVIGEGNIFPSEGAVGIGTTDPTQTLDVKGSIVTTANNGIGLVYISRVYNEDSDSHDGRVWVNDKDGNHTITLYGDRTLENQLEVVGNAEIDGNINFTGNIYQNGNLFNPDSDIFTHVNSADDDEIYSNGVFYDRYLAGYKTLYTYPEFAINHFADGNSWENNVGGITQTWLRRDYNSSMGEFIYLSPSQPSSSASVNGGAMLLTSTDTPSIPRITFGLGSYTFTNQNAPESFSLTREFMSINGYGSVGIGTTNYNNDYAVNIFTDDTNSDDPIYAGISMRTNETPEGRHGLSLSARSDENASIAWSGNAGGGGALYIMAGYGSAMNFSLDPEKDGNYENWLTLSQGLNSAEFYKDVNVDGSIDFTGNLTKNGNLIEFDNALWNTTGDASSGSDLYYRYDLGYVGIGTSSPVRNLHIHASGSGGEGNADLHLTNDATESGPADGATITMIGDGGPGSGTDLLINNREDGDIIFQTNISEKVRIKNSGFVGIGTDAPLTPLTINGHSTNSHIKLVTDETGETWDDGSTINVELTTNDFVINQREEANIRIYNNLGERMRILANGNVGIGEENPSSLLDVGGDINFSGNLLQNGSLVDLGDNTLWNTTGDATVGSILNYNYDSQLTTIGGDLHVAGTISVINQNRIDIQGGVNGESIRYVGDANYFRIQTSGSGIQFEPDYANANPVMTITPEERIGIGTTMPDYELDVNGTIRGDNVSASDIRWKKNIEPIQHSLQKVKQLQGVYYDWKDKSKDSSRQIGFIAQDVEKIFPELVKTDDDGYKSMNYSKMVSILVESVKDLDDENQKLEDRISKLENTIEMLLDEASIDRINK